MHEHSWELIYSVMDRDVRHCTDIKCDAWESSVLDWNTMAMSWVAGNLWMHYDTIYICTGTYEEFQEAASKLVRAGVKNIERLESQVQLVNYTSTYRPALLIWGTWYDNPIVHDPLFAYVLNFQAG